MATITPVDRNAPYSRCPIQTVPDTGTTDFIPAPDNNYHQFDFSNAGNAGTISVAVNFGAGSRVVATVDFSSATRLPVIIFGRIESVILTPNGVTGNTSMSYCASQAK